MSLLKKIFLLLLLFMIFAVLAKINLTHKKPMTVLKFSSWGSQSEVALIKPIIDDFERKNPDIKVEFVHIPQNYFQKLHLLFASNLAPDVVFINNLYLPVYAEAGVLEPLDDKVIDKTAFYDKSIKVLSYKKHFYAVPRDISTLVVYYNKDAFDKYNVPYPTSNWTLKEFLKATKMLTKDTNDDGKTDLWGISFEESPALFYLPYLMSEGGGIISDDLKTNIFNSKESKKGLNFYADLRNKYNVAPKQHESASATMAQMFLQGQLAMELSGRWLVPKFREDAKFRWDVAPFPNGSKGSVVPLDASGWAVSKSSKNKTAAIKLIDFLSSKTSSEKFAKSGLIVPARISVANGKYFLDAKSKPQNAKVFLDAIKTSKPTPVTPDYSEIQDELKEKTNYIFNLKN